MVDLKSERFYVFSTYVEVILFSASELLSPSGILHVCGGDPQGTYFGFYEERYSPRMWR